MFNKVLRNLKYIWIFNITRFIFIINKTHHASRQISTPGWVFDFKEGSI